MKAIQRILLPVILLVSIPLMGQDKKEGLNLDRIADDLKYRNGYRFIELGRYSKALEELNEYLEIFIYGTHRDEAYNNIARIHFIRLDYQKAAGIYRDLFEEYSNSDSGIEGYYNMGVCYQKMGYNQRAAEIFQDIVRNYPESTMTGKAKIQVDLLKILESEN
jgi:TolA-binding protein